MTPRALHRVALISGSALISTLVIAQPALHYEPNANVNGTIRIWGSPQMSELLKTYEEGFQILQPDVRFDVDLKSTLIAVPGVYTGRADIGLLGREIWPTEIQAFEAASGNQPKVIDIATGSYDVPKATYALMIFVPAANPIKSLSTADLERIFGASENPARTWGDLGLRGIWRKRPIHLYGFATDNDKAQIFAKLIFHKDESWNCDLRQFRNGSGPDSDAGGQIVQAVARDPNAIGISNVHYSDSSVRTVPLATAHSQQPIAPTRENVASRKYPLTRAVYLVLDPRTLQANPAVSEFIRFVLSQQGGDAVVKEGNYLPLPPEIAAQELREISKR
jgi:phosphate transport system substrate-binding protein